MTSTNYIDDGASDCMSPDPLVGGQHEMRGRDNYVGKNRCKTAINSNVNYKTLEFRKPDKRKRGEGMRRKVYSLSTNQERAKRIQICRAIIFKSGATGRDKILLP